MAILIGLVGQTDPWQQDVPGREMSRIKFGSPKMDVFPKTRIQS